MNYVEKIVLDGTEMIVKDAQCESNVATLSQTVSGLSGTVSTHGTTLTNLSGTVSSQGTTLTNLTGTVSSQGNTITAQGNTLTSHGNSITSLQTSLHNKVGVVTVTGTVVQNANTRSDNSIGYTLPTTAVITGITVSSNYPSWAQINVGNITNNSCVLGVNNEYSGQLSIKYNAKIAYYIP